MRRYVIGIYVVFFLALITALCPAEQKLLNITLSDPELHGSKPLMQTIQLRQSGRSFSSVKLSGQQLSNLLWAAAGYNRPELNKRTVPSARNWQEIDVYVMLEEGVYLYDAKSHSLEHISENDFRRFTGTQDFVAEAPLNLVYVADTSKMTGSTDQNRDLYMGVDTGFISQNVYLYCASAGFVTVVRAMIDRDALAKALNLPDHKKVTFAQTVGYPVP